MIIASKLIIQANIMYSLNVLFPVLNEERRLEKGILKTIEYMNENVDNPYLLTIIDNGSEDKTEAIGLQLSKDYEQVRYMKLSEKGVGIAFKEGVLANQSDIVGYMDVDLSTDISHISDMLNEFNKDASLKIVNGSRLNRESNTVGRKWYRNITSYGLAFLLKLTLGLKASDAICGFKFMKKETVEILIEEATNDNGWFYIIELLLRAERKNIMIHELPVRWQDDYDSKVDVFKLIKNYLQNIFRLSNIFREERKRA